MKRVIVWLLLVTLLSGCAPASKEETSEVQGKWIDIYYATSEGSEKVIDSEPREIPAVSLISMARYAIEEILKRPIRQELHSPLPPEMEVRSVRFGDDGLIVDLSKEYGTLQGVEKTIADACIVKTLSGFWSAKNITVLIEGKPSILHKKARDFVLSEPKTMLGEQSLTLYFPSENGDMLNTEERKVILKQDDLAEKIAIQGLIEGPKFADRAAVIPPDTKLLSIHTEEGVCYISLSKQFVLNHRKSMAAERMIIKSIVWTLTSIDYIDKVQILIEGVPQRAFSFFNLSNPFSRDNIAD